MSILGEPLWYWAIGILLASVLGTLVCAFLVTCWEDRQDRLDREDHEAWDRWQRGER
jgi:hypothetical protein